MSIVGVTSTYRAKGLSASQETAIGVTVSSKHALLPPPYVTATSVIFDIADTWGGGVALWVRSIEFLLNGALFPLTASDYSAYSTTNYDGGEPTHAFDTSLLKTGDYYNRGWRSGSFVSSNQRLIVVLNTSIQFDEIIINNGHSSGTDTFFGAQNTKITTSTDAITDTTYNAAIANSTVLNDTAWPEHIAADVIDDQTVWTY